MKNIENKYILTIMLIVLMTLIMVASIFTVVLRDSKSEYEKENEKYNIKLKVEQSKVEELDEKIQKLIEEERTSFINEIKALKEINKENELTINGNTNKYNNLYFYHIAVNKFTIKNNKSDKELFYIFDNHSKKFTTINELLKDKNSFIDLSLIIKHLINTYAHENKIKLEETRLNKRIEPLEKNYQNIYLNNDGLTITFSPYEVSSKQDQEVNVLVPWNKLNSLLKEEYQNEKTVKLNRKTRDISYYKNKKVIAFTFDDGPNTETTKILLDNIDKYDAKVTFFMLGSRVDDNKDIIKRAYQEGNDIASHTYSHKDLTKLNNKKLKKEIEKTNKKIKKIIGIEPVYLRPPYGSINDKVRNNMIMHTICWNIDSLDWQTKNRKKIKKEIIKNARDGGIVLVHDIYKESVYGSLLAMKDLKKKGYNFVTITEMAELKNVTLDYDKTYYGF